MCYNLIEHTSDFYTSGHFQMKDTPLFSYNLHNKMYFMKSCANFSKIKNENLDLYIYYPIECLIDDHNSLEFLNKYVKIIKHLGASDVKYMGNYDIQSITSNFKIKDLSSNINNLGVNSSLWLAKLNQYNINLKNNTISYGNKLFDKKDLFPNLNTLTMAVFKISCNVNIITTYYTLCLLRMLFSNHYRNIIVTLLDIKKNCPKFNYTSCLQLAKYSCPINLKDVYPNFYGYNNYYYYYGLWPEFEFNFIKKLIPKEEFLNKFFIMSQLNLNSIFTYNINSTTSKSIADLKLLLKNKKYKELYNELKK
jgi:hypothetical protein